MDNPQDALTDLFIYLDALTAALALSVSFLLILAGAAIGRLVSGRAPTPSR